MIAMNNSRFIIHFLLQFREYSYPVCITRLQVCSYLALLTSLSIVKYSRAPISHFYLLPNVTVMFSLIPLLQP